MLNPRKTAEITVQKTEIFAPHTEFKQMPSSSHIIGVPPRCRGRCVYRRDAENRGQAAPAHLPDNTSATHDNGRWRDARSDRDLSARSGAAGADFPQITPAGKRAGSSAATFRGCRSKRSNARGHRRSAVPADDCEAVGREKVGHPDRPSRTRRRTHRGRYPVAAKTSGLHSDCAAPSKQSVVDRYYRPALGAAIGAGELFGVLR